MFQEDYFKKSITLITDYLKGKKEIKDDHYCFEVPYEKLNSGMITFGGSY